MLYILLYLDPASGSIILQAIIAGVVGAGVAVKLFWHRIVGFFKRDREPISEINNDQDSFTSD